MKNVMNYDFGLVSNKPQSYEYYYETMGHVIFIAVYVLTLDQKNHIKLYNQKNSLCSISPC